MLCIVNDIPQVIYVSVNETQLANTDAMVKSNIRRSFEMCPLLEEVTQGF